MYPATTLNPLGTFESFSPDFSFCWKQNSINQHNQVTVPDPTTSTVFIRLCLCWGGVGGGVSGPASMCYKGPEVWFTFQARQQLIFIEQISCRWVGRCWDEQSSNMEKQQIIDLWDLICRVNLLFLKTNKQKKCFGARNDLAAVDIVRHFSDQKEPRQVPHWLGRLRIILLPH